MQILKDKGHNPYAFRIRNGFRHPAYNKLVSGANKSRHIAGEAIDLHIKDINRDGKYTEKDKAIVIDILEKQVIRGEGGIGKYPGTRAVHFDVRGYRARWDTY